MSLSTRKPTGEAGWPNLLIEGKEGAGKTHACLRLSADPRVGTTFVIEVGERRADEYAALGKFEIVEHDGHLRTIVPAIEEVLVQPPTGGRPNVLVIDSATHLWDLVKRHAEAIARSTKSAVKRLEEDPDADIEIGPQTWNKASDRWWWSWVNELRAWPGIALLTARADEVVKMANGRPVAGQTDYRVDIQKGTPFALDGTVRMRLGHPPLVTTAKSLRFTVPANGLELPADDALAHLVFDLYGAGEQVTLTERQAKSALLAACRALSSDEEQAKALAAEVWAAEARYASEFDAEAMARILAAVDSAVPAGEAA
jgi:hypothetical protein